MDLNLENKLVLITGGSRGIGLAIAEEFAKEGCDLILLARNINSLNNAKSHIELKYKKTVHIYVADALDLVEFEKVLSEIRNNHAPDILINNVGGGGRWGTKNILETNYSTWQDVMNKNLGAAILCVQFFIENMARNKFGRVITISSTSAKEIGGRPWFISAKASEIIFSKSLSKESQYVRNGISFVTVLPGAIDIAGTGWDDEKKANQEQFAQKLDLEFPLGRLGSVQEVAKLVVFAASPTMHLLNGSTIGIDGGESSYI